MSDDTSIQGPQSQATQDQLNDETRIRKALVVSLLLGLVLVAIIVSLFWLLEEPMETLVVTEHAVTGPQDMMQESVVTPPIVFQDITEIAGVDFVHENGARGERLLPERMGGGVAFFDYDNDGDQDLYLVNSMHWPGASSSARPTSKLYRNHGDGTFTDVSSATATDLIVYGMGVAVGDYDGDGWVDMFVTAVGENRLLKNRNGERFEDVTSTMGVAGADSAWSTSAAFFDYDRDGDLDLYVANYVEWSPAIDRAVDYQLTGIGRAYGPPTDFGGSHSYLYRYDADLGAFTDVSAASGIEVSNATTGQPVAKALAVQAADVTGDGWLDIVVANDTVQNFLFINERDGTFREAGIDAGLAFDTSGLATGAMGIDIANYANDEQIAVMIGNFANEMSSFYVVRNAQGVFSDDAIVTGIGAPSRRALTFGLIFFDADLDGRLDVIAANGHVEPDINKVQSSQKYEQPVQLFWNCGSACNRDYRLVETPVGRPVAGRGAAYADIDGDGDLDVMITAVGGKPMLLRNDTNTTNEWIRLQLIDTGHNRYAVGARVSVLAGRVDGVDGVDSATLRRSVMPGRSYLSQMELPVTFGLGQLTTQSGNVAPGDGESVQVDVTVTWPDGESESWQLEPNKSYELLRGTSH